MTARAEAVTAAAVRDEPMELVRVAIVDDEPLSRLAMRQLLLMRSDVAVVAECSSAAELASVTDADAIFLDIQMPVQSGLDWRRNTHGGAAPDGPPFVVFVTAYEEYALPAFDVGAIDYLTKPVTPARLDRAMVRLHERLAAHAALASRREMPAATLPTTASGAPRAQSLTSLVTRIGKRDVIIPLAQIDVLEADGVYAAVHVSGRRHLVRRSLDDLERALSAARFLRVHRSFLVRRSAVVEAHLGATVRRRELVLANGATVPVSRRRQAAVARWIKG